MSKSKTKSHTQKMKILNHLGQGKSLTVAQARKMAITNPSAVVSALRDDQHEIYTVAVKQKNGHTVLGYSFDQTNRVW